MAEIRVDSVIDMDAVNAEIQKLLSSLGTVKQSILDVNSNRINLKSSDVADYTAATNNLNTAIVSSTTATTGATKAAQQLTEAQVAARLANQQRTAAIKDEVLASQAATGSYNALQLQLKSLTAQYKALSDVERNSATGVNLKSQIDSTNTSLKNLDAGLGNYQRNVGNYSGAISGLAKGIKGLGGLGVILSQAIGIDPAIAEGIREAGTALRDFSHAQEATSASTKAKSTAQDIDTTSTVANSTATKESVVSQDALTTSTDAAAVSLDAEATSADVATASTEAFSDTIGSTLAGSVVIALAGITALVLAVKNYNNEIDDEQKAMEALKLIIGDLSTVTSNYEKLREVSAQNQINELSQKIALQKAEGVSAVESLALDSQLAQQQLKNANDAAARYNITKENVDRAKQDAAANAAQVIELENQKQAILQKTAKVQSQTDQLILDTQSKAVDQKIESLQKEASATQTFYDFINTIYQKQITAQNQINLITSQTDKLNADEHRALLLAQAQSELEITQSNNAKILASDASTQAQKISALKSSQAVQLNLINQTLQNTLNDPTKNTDPNLVLAAQAKASADRIKVNNDTITQIEAVNIKFRNDELKANADYNNALLAQDEERQKDSLTDRYTDLQSNIDAIQKIHDDENQVLKNNYDLQLNLGMKFNSDNVLVQTLSESQLKALHEQYTSGILANDIATNNQIVAAQEKAVDDQVAALKYLHDQSFALATNTSQASSNVSATDEVNQAILDEEGKNADQRAKIETNLQNKLEIIDKRGQLDRLSIQDDELESQKAQWQALADAADGANAYELGQVADTESKITANKLKESQLRMQIVDAEVKHEEDQRNKLLDKVQQGETALLDTLQAFGDATYQRQKDDAQNQEDILTDQTQHEIDLENASVDSAQDKANKIAIINARASAEKAQLDKQERKADHDKAVFDKEIAILEIVAQIAIDIAKGQFFTASLAGAALIKLIATPVPAYKHGRGEGKEEMAIVGDGGVNEYIMRENGNIEKTPRVDTLTHLMPKDRVFKNKDSLIKELSNETVLLSNYSVNKNGGIEKSDIERMTNRIEQAVNNIKVPPSTQITKEGWRMVNEKNQKYDQWVQRTIKN